MLFWLLTFYTAFWQKVKLTKQIKCKPLTLPVAAAMTEGSQRLSRVSISRKMASCWSISCSSLWTSSSTCSSSPPVNSGHTLTECPPTERQHHVAWSQLDWTSTNRKTASWCSVTPWLKIHQQKDGVMVLCHTLTENPPTEKLRHVALSHLDWKSTRRKTASCCTISCSTLLASSSMSTCQQRLHFIGYPLEERL